MTDADPGPIDPLNVARAVANTTAALTHSDDIAGVLATLVAECAATLTAGAVGIMVLLPSAAIEVLSASSHQALELELYQSQLDSGPCLESIRTVSRVSEQTAFAMQARWPALGRAITDAGYLSVHAEPMTWQGRPIGGLNIFRVSALPLTDQEQDLAAAFADMATLAVVHAGHVTAEQAAARALESLTSRTAIEQAKGVLAYQHRIDMAAAYETLRQRALQTGQGLTHTALTVLREVSER
jgi:GAF domain-containing protein